MFALLPSCLCRIGTRSRPYRILQFEADAANVANCFLEGQVPGNVWEDRSMRPKNCVHPAPCLSNACQIFPPNGKEAISQEKPSMDASGATVRLRFLAV